jgi:hypothetical protein
MRTAKIIILVTMSSVLLAGLFFVDFGSNKKIPFNRIGSLVAQVVDAKALGVTNYRDNIGPRNAGKKSQAQSIDDNQNKLVKVTETYNPVTNVLEDQTIEVTFQRKIESQTTELQTDTATYIATANPLDVEIINNEPGKIGIKNTQGYEYRLLSEGVVLNDWTSSDEDNLEFYFNNELNNLTVESRSLNASITFISFDDFTYTVKRDEITIHEGLKDNDVKDTNLVVGNITITGLIQGVSYDVTYEGYQVIETIHQDEVDGQIDKLLVLDKYTFISFIPLNQNYRPIYSDLTFDYDGLAFYDKMEYHSNSVRQSFVVDNDTGLIYKIENVDIEMISRGILWLQNNLVPHDLRINSSGELEFFPLFTNTSIIAFDAFKDTYGNTFVFNNRLNSVDLASKTTFYVAYVNYWGQPNSQLGRVIQSGFDQDQLSVAGFAKGTTYWLTETNHVLKIDSDLNTKDSGEWMKNVKMFGNQHQEIDVPLNETFKVYDFKTYDHSNGSPLLKPYRISNGRLFSETINNNILSNNNRPGLSQFRENGELAVYDIELRKNIFFELRGSPARPWNPDYLLEEDILIEYVNGNIYTIYHVSDFLSQMFEYAMDYMLGEGNGFFRYWWGGFNSIIESYNQPTLEWWRPFLLDSNVNLDYQLIIDNVGIVNGEVSRFGASGNITYELILEYINGNPTLVAYVTGNYVAPLPTTITFQPINR